MSYIVLIPFQMGNLFSICSIKSSGKIHPLQFPHFLLDFGPLSG